MSGCNQDERRGEISFMFDVRSLETLAVNETKLKGRELNGSGMFGG